MLRDFLQDEKKRVESFLKELLVSPNQEYKTLYESMNYSLLMGGKRIRPILTAAVLNALGKDPEPFRPVITAIELIHTYSLIHDDLPAMDDDEYRRGSYTNHVVFGDGMAILAGDGLLTQAFQLMCSDSAASAEQKVACIQVLSEAAGPAGMVGGQAFDLQSEGKDIGLEELKVLHRGKTGALFKASVAIGLILADADAKTQAAYLAYADQLGLLFQITDDILDVTGTVEELGKAPGSDEKQHKATYVSLLSLPEARQCADEAAGEARQALAGAAGDHGILLELVDYLVSRSS